MTVKYEDNNVFLQVRGGKWEKIGEMEDDVFIVKRNPETHLMHYDNTYGFSKDIIDSDKVQYVLVIEQLQGKESKYLLEKTELIANSTMYQAEGYERQYSVPVEFIRTK